MDSKLLPVGNTLLNTDTHSSASRMQLLTDTTVPFFVSSVDNLSSSNLDLKGVADNIANGNCQIDPAGKPTRIIGDKLTKKTIWQKVEENSNKEKSKIKDLPAGTSQSENLQYLLSPHGASKVNSPLNKNISPKDAFRRTGIVNSYQQQISENSAKLDTRYSLLVTRPAPARSAVTSRVSSYDKANMQINHDSRLSPFPVTGSAQDQKKYSSNETGYSQTILSERKSASINSKAGSAGKKTVVSDINESPASAGHLSALKKSVTTNQNMPATQEKSTPIASKQTVYEAFTTGTINNAKDVKTPEKSRNSNKKDMSYNPLGQNFIQKPNITKLQIYSSQIKDSNDNQSYNNLSQELERLLSLNNAHSLVSEQPRISNKAVNITEQTAQSPQKDISTSISQQIIESINASLHQADRCVTIHLEPPDLGHVFVRFKEQQNQITGLLEVSKAETKHEIEQALPQMMKTLEDCGIQIKRLEVQLADQFQPQADRNLAGGGLEEGSYQHKNFAEGGNSNGNGEELLINIPIDSYQNYTQPGTITTDQSINILI